MAPHAAAPHAVSATWQRLRKTGAKRHAAAPAAVATSGTAMLTSIRELANCSKLGSVPLCGAPSDTHVTPTKTATAPMMSGTPRASGAPSHPDDAKSSEKTMVSPANGATTDSGKKESESESHAVCSTAKQTKPHNQ